MGIREKRLENDFKELSQLISESGGTLSIISTQGKPPHQYIIEYRCKGIERLNGSEPIFRTNHRVEILEPKHVIAKKDLDLAYLKFNDTYSVDGY